MAEEKEITLTEEALSYVFSDVIGKRSDYSSQGTNTLRKLIDDVNTSIGDVDISTIGDSVTDSISKVNSEVSTVKEHLQQVVESDVSASGTIWNEQWELGGLTSDTGTDRNDLTNIFRSVGYIPIKPNTTYYFLCTTYDNQAVALRFYGSNKAFISPLTGHTNRTFTTPSNAQYMRFNVVTDYGQPYNNDISIFEYEEGKTYSYVPYIKSAKQLTDEVGGINSSLGTVTNMLKSTLQSSVVDTVTCTKNNDGTYTLNTSNPTTTANGFTLGTIDVKKGKAYKIVGCPKGGGESKYRLWTISSTAFPINHRLQDTGDGTVMTALADETVTVTINFGANQSFSNFVFKPMICTNQNAQYSDFVAFTGSTGKLTSDVAELNRKIVAGTFTYTPTMTQYSDNKLYRDITDKSITVNGITSNSIIYIGVISNNKAWVGRVLPAKNTLIRLDIFSTENITTEITFQYIAINP